MALILVRFFADGACRVCVAGGAVLLPDGTGCSSRTGMQRSSMTKVRLRRERMTEQDLNPDLPLSGADSR